MGQLEKFRPSFTERGNSHLHCQLASLSHLITTKVHPFFQTVRNQSQLCQSAGIGMPTKFIAQEQCFPSYWDMHSQYTSCKALHVSESFSTQAKRSLPMGCFLLELQGQSVLKIWLLHHSQITAGSCKSTTLSLSRKEGKKRTECNSNNCRHFKNMLEVNQNA